MVEFRSFQVAPDCAWGTSAVAQELYAHAQDLPALKDEEETRIWRLEHPNHGHLFLKEYRLPRRRRWFASRARSRAGRETRGLVAMTAADLPVAPPCFSVERWEGSRLLSSFLVTSSLGQVRPLPVYLAGAGDEGLALCGEVEVIDGYLLAAILLIFALGLYELFISRIDDAVGDQASANVLVINSLDDLKTRLGKVILMVLVVKFFEFGISMDIVEPMDLLLFGGGIALVGVALWLTNAKAHAD